MAMSYDDAKSDRELLLEVRSDVRYLREVRADHEARIRALEKRVWYAAGIAAAFAFIAKLIWK